jgi:hypothetical protein
MDTTNLTWREKIGIIETTARIAVAMFLVLALFCELLIAASN